MTAAGERAGSAGTARRPVERRRLLPAVLPLVAALTLVVGLSGCTSGSAADGASGPPPGAAVGTLPVDDEAAIRSTIDALNDTAAGTVAGQQAVLTTLVEPTLSSALDDCPPATTTLRFEPVYQGLRAAPGWTGTTGSLTGTVYALPTLIRIYTGDRITGTDLTTLHLGVDAGEAYITPLCVG